MKEQEGGSASAVRRREERPLKESDGVSLIFGLCCSAVGTFWACSSICLICSMVYKGGGKGGKEFWVSFLYLISSGRWTRNHGWRITSC